MKFFDAVFFGLFLAMPLGSSASNVVRVSKEEMTQRLQEESIKCYYSTMSRNDTEYFGCPAIWDGILCWPKTVLGTVAKQPCPDYVNKFNTDETAFRECLPNGMWLEPRDGENQTFEGWTNFSLCLTNDIAHDTSPNEVPGVILLLMKHVEEFRMMYNVGYALSFVSLLLAAFVMIYFRKLHCARNYIHLNLFVAFLLRALVNIIRENVWIHFLGFPGDVTEHPNGTVTFNDGPHWECRLFFSLHQYAIVASYMWIFVEAIYIHMVIFVAVFTEKTKVVCYMIFGWSIPLPFVIAWAVSRLYLDNTYCWSVPTAYTGLSWIIDTPVMISVILNAVFFVNIVRLLVSKLNSFPHSETNRYRTLAKSVVVLIPLFGVYYIVFQLPASEMGDTANFAFLVIEMFFNSYQGLFIAILLCFTNAEVRNEVKRSWNRMYLRRCSTASRASQFAMSQQRSFSTTTKVCELTRLNSVNKTYPPGRNASTSDFEASVPFTAVTLPQNSNTDDERYLEMPETQSKTSVDNVNEREKTLENGHTLCNPDELKLKINVVNIECQSRDGVSKNTTSLAIHAMKNGRAVQSENILNNNVQETVTVETTIPTSEI